MKFNLDLTLPIDSQVRLSSEFSLMAAGQVQSNKCMEQNFFFRNVSIQAFLLFSVRKSIKHWIQSKRVCLHRLLMTLAYRVCTNQKEKSMKGVGSDEREGAVLTNSLSFSFFALPWLNPDLAVASLHWEDELEIL